MKNILPILFSIIFMTSASAQVYFKTRVVQEEFPSMGIASIDLDQDGKRDLIRVNTSRDEISVMFNDGLDQPFETFQRGPNFFSPRDLLVADFDNDGDDDFSVISEDELNLQVNLLPDFTVDIADGILGLEGYDAKDIDGDNDFDFAAVEFWGERISLWEDKGGLFYNGPTFNTPQKVKRLALGQFIGDDVYDFACTGETNGIFLFENEGFDYPMTAIDADYESPSDLKSFDMDGDGDFDIWVASSDRDEMVWYEQDNGSFTKRMISTSAKTPTALHYDDMEGDGDMDLFTVARDDGQLLWWENDGDQNYTQRVVASGLKSPRDISTGDMDGDGDLDVIGCTSAIREDERVYIFEQVQEPTNTAELYTGDWSVSPNPAQDYIVFSLYDTNEKIKLISLRDLTGRVLFESTPQSNQVELNLSDFSTGLYLLSVNLENSVISEKIIITR